MTAVQSLNEMPIESLRRLHRGIISNSESIVALLERACREQVILHNGVDRKSEPRTAQVIEVSLTELVLNAPNLVAGQQPQIYLHLEIGSTRYFFATPPISGGGEEPLRLCLPKAVYEAERRDLLRVDAPRGKSAPRVFVVDSNGKRVQGVLRDWSYQGMGVSIPVGPGRAIPKTCRVRVVEGEHQGESRYAAVRRQEDDTESPGWIRLGLEVSAVGVAEPFEVERRDHVLEGGVARRAWRKVALVGAMARRLPVPTLTRRHIAQDIEPVAYKNSRGQEIRGLVDRAKGGKGGVAVVIPPAWGRTKETFLPLARAVAATFEANGTPVSVLRFDGTNRRGESHIDDECRAPGDEYLHYTFSQAVDDVRSSLTFARTEFRPEKVVLVTFSLGAVEGRRAVAQEAAGSVDGWVSVVGMVDLQSGLRTVSGGLDFAYGQSMGVEFGRHELVGVVADMDLTGRDAFEHGLVFLEDAKQDMAKIALPVTWLHGRYDGWMDLERVRALMAVGRGDNRRLIEIPAGHQMRSSTEALETFQLVSSEVYRMATGTDVEPAMPDLGDLERRMITERSRRPAPKLNRSGFWSDYLLGRDRRLGFELMSATSAYRALMAGQVRELNIFEGSHVLDLGSGTGDFAVNLEEANPGAHVRITQVDLIPEALRRSRERLNEFPKNRLKVQRLVADLDMNNVPTIPIRSGSVDSVIASLVLSYVDQPEQLVAQAYRVLRGGGRIVVSSMRRDADISRIYVDSIAELPPDRRESHFGTASAGDFEELQRVFLNDAAKLLQMEEEGRFRFFDGDELASMLSECGFESVKIELAFGDPPQAVCISAIRPRS
jgi:ubiquinone/menaquinone biosynthesis C-methylase UbiE/pimeloyl-ACP methyl ester carboxylesterase